MSELYSKRKKKEERKKVGRAFESKRTAQAKTWQRPLCAWDYKDFGVRQEGGRRASGGLGMQGDHSQQVLGARLRRWDFILKAVRSQ